MLPVLRSLVFIAFPVIWGCGAALAEEVTVAVAANFLDALKTIQAAYEKESSDKLLLVPGSSGKLAAQIIEGAPFDVMLSADAARPHQLLDKGKAVESSSFTYAEGRLVLWSADPKGIAEDGAATLKEGKFAHLAIANPKLAPYGVAALETLAALGLTEATTAKIVQGENIGQTFSMIATGNAELGFIALSQVTLGEGKDKGSRWVVPTELHKPIDQDAVLLAHGEHNNAAKRFLAFLKSAPARDIIAAAGYAVPND
jgi:molybdate transport system substrate-binding protein